MTTDRNNCRLADLHLAYQHGEYAAKGDTTSEPQFKEKFADDVLATAAFERGRREQQARQVGFDGWLAEVKKEMTNIAYGVVEATDHIRKYLAWYQEQFQLNRTVQETAERGTGH
ncbi:hypothetical protein [Duganella sp. LjRoot269]|uniref:hypothetical protein n=1 Tax=Duganella sp. LjRoot269 TaxID=3342305 RepID=UPI003ECFBC2C